MSITTPQARALLRKHGLRVTAPRVAVLRLLAAAEEPLSHTEVVRRIGDADWDPATVYRNLVKLRDAGVAVVVTHAGGVDRYTLTGRGHDEHPHFLCRNCGRVVCLPPESIGSVEAEGAWSASLRDATIQLEGTCPACLVADQPGKR